MLVWRSVHSLYNSPPGGDMNPQYALYCSNQCLVRLLIVVLLYFFMGEVSQVCGGGDGSVPDTFTL